MSHAVSLTELLDGNSKKKKLERLIVNPDEPLISGDELHSDNSGLQDEDIDASSMVISEDILPPVKKTSSQTLAEKEPQSVQDFLMSRKNKRKVEPIDDLDNTVIISSDIEETSQDGVFVDNVEFYEKSSSKQMPSKVSYPANFKTTRLKDLFKDLKQAPSKPIELNSATVTRTLDRDGISKKKRKTCSKPTSIEAPFPSKQLIEPDNDNIKYRKLHISCKKRNLTDQSTSNFESFEYELLTAKENKQHNKMFTKISTNNEKHASLWTRLMKPKSINDVLLDKSLKSNVSAWISQAFMKLKRPTTRHKLLKRQRVEDKTPLDDFIVNDETDEDATGIREFVPIMILFGEGIGKNTLIEVIMKQLGGHVYEIDTSSNRSKKNIFDSLKEFSTSHYVKGKGAKGVILFDDVDVLFKEHDKFFWQAVERVLLGSRRPILLLCRDLNYIPYSIVRLAADEGALFHAKKVSSQTVIRFLQRYCQRLGLDISVPILELLVNSNNNDIRKCLMELQFICTFPGGFSAQSDEKRDFDPGDLNKAALYADSISSCNILLTKTEWMSSIAQHDDLTLMSPQVVAKYNNFSEDQEKLRNDYLIDYRLHLLNKINHRMLPFELNIAKEIYSTLKKIYPLFEVRHLNTQKSFNNICRAAISYLSTRIDFQQQGTEVQARRTRNSKKYQEILDSFDGKYAQTSTEENIKHDFAVSVSKNIKEQVYPFAYEIAKSDALSKEKNKQVFLDASKGVAKDQYDELVYKLLAHGAMKPIWFKGNPKLVIDN